MTFLIFIGGLAAGALITALFSTSTYNNGFKDGAYIKQSTKEYIKSLEKSNKYWQEETYKQFHEKWKIKLEKVK